MRNGTGSARLKGKSTRTAVVLAAGLGSRLDNGRGEAPKPARSILGRPLVIHVLETLVKVGIERIVMVVGYEAGRIMEKVDSTFSAPERVEYVVNPEYRKSNGISAIAGLRAAGGPCLLVMADHVVDAALYQRALHTVPPPEGLLLCVDRRVGEVFDLDDATKVCTRDGRIIEIGKELPHYDAIDTGVFHVTQGLRDALEFVVRERGDASLSDGVRVLAEEGRASVLDVEDCFWQDIDTPEMLDYALSQRAHWAAG